MEYTLMHKNVPVLDVFVSSETGYIYKCGTLHNPEHLPMGVLTRKDGSADRAALNEWWTDRSIPAERKGVSDLLKYLEIPCAAALSVKSLGLSLSDQYWISPLESGLDWHDVNFFDNPFSEDIGNLLLTDTIEGVPENIDISSPDNTSDGFLKKKWKITDGKRCLIKAGSAPFYQQPFNEVIASTVMDRLSIPHVSYSLTWIKGFPYSVCENFITPDTDLVPAWRVTRTRKKDNNISLYRHYVECCEDLGVDMIHSLNQMMALDYIIANEDRHFNNFGLLRNADTLEWIGAAPIFDSGSSLGYNKTIAQILSGKNIECKPFKSRHEEQLKLVTNFSWIKLENLLGIDKEIRDIFSCGSEYIDEARAKAIADYVLRRIDKLHKFANEEARFIDDKSYDVKKNTAASYGNAQTGSSDESFSTDNDSYDDENGLPIDEVT